MEEVNTTIMTAVLFIFLGWLLGMLSPIVVNAITKRYRNIEIRKAILSELDDARLYFVCEVYLIESRLCVYNRQLFDWVLPILENYQGPNPAIEVAECIRKNINKISDDQVAELAKIKITQQDTVLSLKKYRLQYLEARIADLGGFDEKSQAILMNIRGKVDLYNQEVDEARFYFKLTFDAGISPQNHKLAAESLEKMYRHIAKLDRDIVERINLLEPLPNNKHEH